MNLRDSLVYAALFTLAGASPAAHADVDWRHIPGLSGPGHAGMQIGDFDGDGRQELAVTAWGSASFGFNGDQALVVHQPGSGPGSPLRRTHITLSTRPFISPIRLVRRPDRPDALLTAVEASPGGAVTLQLLSGLPLRVEREISAPAGFRPLVLADVDGDSNIEILGLVGQQWSAGTLLSIDFKSGTTAWSSTESATTLAALQFDADMALEIVLGGQPGRILDGATRQVQTTYPAGFGQMLVTGNFDNNPATTELASGGSWTALQIFQGAPFSPIGEVNAGEIAALVAQDINGDGVTELVVGSGQWGTVRALNPMTGAAVFTLQNPEHGTSALAIGNVDGLPGDEVAFGAGLSSSGRDIVSVNSMSGQNLYLSSDEQGPHSPTLLADVDGDQAEDAVFVVRATDSNYNGAKVYVLDGATGAVKNSRAVSSSGFSSGAVGGLFAEQLDQDAPLEIGIGVVGTAGNGVSLLDGSSLQPQWGSGSASFGSVDSTVADVNADGTREILAATSDSRLTLVNAATGALIWNSVSLGSGGATALAVANLDADPALEMLIAVGTATYAFDGSTRLLEWSMSTGNAIKGLQVWGSGADCRIGGWADLAMVVYRCSDRQIMDSITLPAGGEYARVIDADLGLVMVAHTGRLMTIRPGFGVIHMTSYLGAGLGAGNRGVVRTIEAGRRYDALFGSNLQVVRLKIDLDELSADGFE